MERTTRKKKLGGYPAIGVIVSITLALFVMGLFGVLVIYSQALENQVRKNIRLQVYLRPAVTENQRVQIENTLLSQNYVHKENGRGVEFISKEAAAEKFIAETGEDFKQFIGDNPLRDAFLVSIDPSHHTQEQMEKIKADIKKMKGVFEVYYVESLLESVNANITKIGIILSGMTVILLIAVIMLINNTLRLALFSQRFLIRSMQLVGAKKWFIQWPFLVRSIGYGLLGASFAGLLLWLLTDYAQKKITDLTLLHNQEQFIILLGMLLVTGALIAFLSTYFSIRKYLKMSLDELY